MRLSRAVAVLSVVFACFTTSLAFAAWPTDPAVNLPVVTAAGGQIPFGVCPDTSGGVYIVTYDLRSGVAQTYVSHVLRTGVVDPAWPVNGLLAGGGAGGQNDEVITPDGSGGVYVAWSDQRNGTWDIYAQHLTSSGTRYAGWPAAGLMVGACLNWASVAADDYGPAIARDASGGLYVTWTSVFNTSGDYDVWGNHLSATGAAYVGWGSGLGKGIDRSGSDQSGAVILGDPNGNVLVAYQSKLSGNFDLYCSAYGPTGTQLWSADQTNYGGDQTYPRICGDGSTGAFVAYVDKNAGLPYIGLTNFSAAGSSWGSTAATSQFSSWSGHELIADGTGGLYLEWNDFAATHLVRLNSAGHSGAGWSAGGIAINSPVTRMISDGAHGVIAVDANSDQAGARRYTSAGVLAAGWGLPSLLSLNYAYFPLIATDGQGGAIEVWADVRNQNVSGYDIYAQRIDRFGALGDASPAIVKVKDVPNDQGGNVRVTWNASSLDVSPTPGIWKYLVYRQVPAALAANMLARGTATLAEDGATASPARGAKVLRATTSANATWYWELVQEVPAQMLPGYSLVASTVGDSVGGSNPYTVFMIDAINGLGAFWTSSADSGYSVDNLPPVAPAPFTGAYHAGVGTVLSWMPNGEADLAGYRLYKGGSASFVPGPGNRIAQLTGNASFTDPSLATGWYKLSAYDVHGNESAFATLLPSGVTSVDASDAPHELAFALASANPVRGAATLRLALPAASRVHAAIYDAAGRVVRTLADDARAAGTYALAWDGADADGHAVASGLYFARVRVAGRALNVRMVVAR